MPSSKGYKRNYAQEYKTAKKRGEVGTGSDGDNARRKRDRRALEKKLGRKLRSDEEVDHIKPLSKGGSSDSSNLRVKKKSANRSYKRNSDGSIKSKGKK